MDAGLPGQATAAGAGIVCPWSSALADDAAWYALACASARHYPGLVTDLAELGETNVGYRQVGALILADSRSSRRTSGSRCWTGGPGHPRSARSRP